MQPIGHRKAPTLSERHDLLVAIQARRAERRGRPTPKRKPGEGNSAQLGGILTPSESRDSEAKEAGFSSHSEADLVATVITQGTQELVEAMESADLSIGAAAVIAQEPPADPSVRH